MQVSSEQYELLSNGLGDAFDYDELRQMLQFSLGQNIEHITRAPNVRTDIFNLIAYYNRKDQVELLVQGGTPLPANQRQAASGGGVNGPGNARNSVHG